jgi:hypothetical protein
MRSSDPPIKTPYIKPVTIPTTVLNMSLFKRSNILIAHCGLYGKKISHANAQCRKEDPWKRGSALRLCAFA